MLNLGYRDRSKAITACVSEKELERLRIEKEKEKFCDIFSSPWIRDGRTRKRTTRKYSVSFSSVLRAIERERERGDRIAKRKERFCFSVFAISLSLFRSRSAFPGVREREEE